MWPALHFHSKASLAQRHSFWGDSSFYLTLGYVWITLENRYSPSKLGQKQRNVWLQPDLAGYPADGYDGCVAGG
jgi:hypothetical protein